MEQDARHSLLLRTKTLRFFHLILLLSFYSEANADEPAVAAKTTPKLFINDSSRKPVLKIDYRKQRLINQTLLRNSQQRELLSHYEQLILDDDTVDAVMLYQQILDNQKDSFDWTAAGELISIKAKAHDLFERHPNAWEIYQKLYSGTAKNLYDPDKIETWKETTDRYFHTPAGLAAQKRLAAKAWDEGRFGEVTQRLLKIIKSPVHQKQLSEKELKQAYLAAGLSDNKVAQQEIDNFILKTKFFPSNLIEELAAVSENLDAHFRQQNIRQPRSWKQPRQSGNRNLFAHDTAPMIQPEWVYTKTTARAGHLLNEQQRKLRSSLQKWSSLQQEHLFPEISSQFAIVANNLLLFRDFDSIQAIQLLDTNEKVKGKIIWKFESPSPISTAFKTHNDPYTGITSNHPSIERLHLANSVTGTLTANNETVFLIDSVQRIRTNIEIQTASLKSSPHRNSRESEQPYDEYLTNRLVALSLQNNTNAPVARWMIDRSGWSTQGNETIHKHLLSGHYFFGPPTVSHHRAYVLSEHHSLVSLTALEASSGKVLWSQPISYSDRPLEYDISRATHASLPVCTEEYIICDNGNGHLIALDSITGNFQWLHCYADDDNRQDSGRWTYTQSTQASHAGVMNVPVPLGNRIVILPDRSRRIQCCDIHSGELLWSQPRENVQYIAAVTARQNKNQTSKEFLLCVANRSCIALDPVNGKEIWKTETGIISGHGVQVGNLFLLPVDTEEQLPQSDIAGSNSHVPRGRIETIDLSTGKRIENGIRSNLSNNSQSGNASEIKTHLQDDYFPSPVGNLIVCKDRIISVGIDRIVSYAQAGSVSRQLKEKQEMLSEKQHQQLAQAEMILGNQYDAIRQLRQALSQTAISPDTRKQTREIFREILYRELQGAEQNQLEILAEIKPLATTLRQQARYLASEIDLYQKQHDDEKLWSATVQFTELGLHIPLVIPDQRGYQQTTKSWLPGLYRQFLKQMTPHEKEQFLAKIEQVWLKQVDSISTHQLQMLAEIFSDYTQVDSVRFELANRAIASGNYQQAELILIRLQHSASHAATFQARQKLSEINSLLGIYSEVAQKQTQSAIIARTAKTSFPYRQVAWKRQTIDRKPVKRYNESVIPVHHVSIKQQPSLSMIHKDPYSKRRSVYSNPSQNWTLLHQPDLPSKRISLESKQKPTSPLLQIISNPVADSYEDEQNEQMLVFLDRLTGQDQFEIRLPGTRFGLVNGTRKQVGHLLPVVASGSIYGISLIEGKAIWKRKVGRSKNSKQRIELGPIGRGFCIYQTVRSLVCLNPINGNLLWKRSDLEPRGGLWANRHTGLIGDEKCIVYFHADHNHYTLLDRETGSVIRKDVLVQAPFLVQRTRRAFGRKLMYLTVSESQPHQRYLRLWDPFSSSLLIDEAFGVQDLYSASEEELTILFAEGRLLIYHPEQERTIAKIDFDAEEMGTTNYLRVASQGDFYLVNLYRSQRADNEQGYTSRFTDSPWKVTHINGPVLAICKRSGQLKWIRSFSNRTIINEQIGELPLLLTCATYQSRPGDQQRTMLLEIIDLKTGDRLVSRKDLAIGRLLLLNHHQNKGEILLSGLLNDIVISYRNNRLSRLKQHQAVPSEFIEYAAR